MCRSPELLTFLSRAVTLFPEDTVLSALQVMQQHEVHVLPVVDGHEGAFLGEVTQDELHRLARRMPLIRLAEILTARSLARAEETTVARFEPLRMGSAGGRFLH
jgi:CBS-domain-containing membrane protein